MKEMYFDYKDCMLRTHVALQQIKKIAGNKLYLYTRKRLAELYVLCKYGPEYPTMDSFKYTVVNLEKYLKCLEVFKTPINIHEIDKILCYNTDDSWEPAYWFGVPVKTVENMNLYQFSKFIEDYKNKMEDDDEWDEVDEFFEEDGELWE
jgi:hypothetical protein